MVQFGLDPTKIGAAARARRELHAYVELHIEQGPVLEQKNLPVGVVTAISGATRLAANLSGMAGHAGTVPMAWSAPEYDHDLLKPIAYDLDLARKYMEKAGYVY